MLFAVVFLILGSNSYLNLRSDIMGYRFKNEFNPDQSLSEIIFDFESSDENFEERHSALPLFSKIINDIRLNEDLSNGEILKSSVNNVIPSVLITRPKRFIDDDIIIADQLKISRDDFNTNLYSSFYMDFGWLGILIQPAILLLYFLLSAMILQTTSNSHLFSSLIFAEVLNTSLNIETSMTGVLSSFRLLIILIGIYFVFNRIIYGIFKG